MISVIVPVYNAENSIERALDSISSQTWAGDFEIIVINDGSTDRSSEIIEQYRQDNPQMNIVFKDQDNGGVSKARNAGLRIAKGEYIALLDADDEWLPQKTQKQMDYLENIDCDIDFLATARNNRILFPYTIKNNVAEITFRKLLIRNEAQTPTVIFKRKILENTGFFDEQQRYAEDLNYWLRISLKNKMYILHENLVFAGQGKRTFGVSGLSANLPEMERGFQKNLREMLLMKRINTAEFVGYYLFYKFKFIVRLLRDRFLKLQGR
ncbi:glycosyltransferase family 2 protein [Chryseobacterium sp.]|uniref:glycosyltransferase family 2 protein n=1 Tax=Chryseobacterium sp. TaxID=1871047 RepID=UPI00162A1158|nr:glycosyltransferase [Chryseobacterium sp.]